MNKKSLLNMGSVKGVRLVKRGALAVALVFVLAFSFVMAVSAAAYAGSGHNHSWSYSLSTTTTTNDTITATCGNDDCNYIGTDFTLTLSASDVEHDGKTHQATLSGSSIAGQYKLPAIMYVGVSGTSYAETYKAPHKVGTYEASITIDGKKASVQFSITKVKVAVPTAVEGLTYTGAKQTGVVLPNGAKYTLSGNENYKAGNHTAIAKLKDKENTEWDLGTSTTSYDQNISWSIAKVQIDVPEAVTGLTYTGSKQTGVVLPNGAKYTLSGNENYLAGNHTATATLKDADNYEWNIQTPSSAPQTISWSIAKAKVDLPAANSGLIYTGANQIGVTVPQYAKYILTDNEGYNAGDFEATATLKDADNYEWNIQTPSSAPQTISWSIAKAKVDLPNAITGLVYDGSEQRGIEHIDYPKYTLSGHKEINAGDYEATATLKDTGNYEWNIQVPSSAPQTISWSIAKATPVLETFTLTLPEDLVFDGTAKEATVTLSSDFTGMGTIFVKYRNANQEFVTPINVGDYDIIVASQEGDNFFATTSDITLGSMTITRKAVTVTADDKEMFLGNDVPAFTAKTTGLVGTDKIVYTFNTINPEEQGTFDIIVSGDEEQGNYIVSYVSGKLFVIKVASSIASISQDDLNKVLEKYRADVRYVGKDLVVEIRTEGPISEEDRNLIIEAIGSDKTVVFINVDLTLVVSDQNGSFEENIGDENDQLIAISYDFDFNKKINIQVFRAHEDANGVTTVEEIKETPNARGEYIVLDREAGKIIVYAMKYSTYSISYDQESDSIAKTGDANTFALGTLACLMVAGAAIAVGASVLIRRKQE